VLAGHQEKALSGSASLSFTHDAWNRLVIVRRMFGGFGSSASLAEYQYNGLHQRIIKRVDTSNPGTSGYETLDRQHQFYYTAAWQIAEELIEYEWSEIGPSTVHQTNEYVWGVRHVDDIVLRRSTMHDFISEGVTGTFYHLTDHQFSTVALIDNAAKLVERVTYDAYGEARQHHAADLTGDGAVGTADQTAMAAAYKGKIGDAEYNVDADISRTGEVSGSDLAWTSTQNFKAALPKGWLSVRNVGNTIGYAGYVFNPEISIYTVRFRNYDPGLGRWLERDPLGYVDGMSLYEYVQGNSVNAFDPFGLCSIRNGGTQGPTVEGPVGPTPTFRPLGPGELPPPGGQTIVNPDGWGRSGFFGNAADITYKHLGDYVKGAVVGAAIAVAAVAVIAVVAAASPAWGIVVGGGLAIYGLYGIYALYSDWDDYSDAQKAGILGGVLGGFAALRPGVGIARRVPTRARTNTSGSSSAGCFLAGTLVVTAAGMAPIEQVEVGESVWSYDHEAEQWELREVLLTFEHDYFGDLVTLKLEFDDGSTDEITATGNHPFWVVEGEELAERPAVEKLPEAGRIVNPYGTGGRWTEARWLRLGDHFLTRTGKSATVAGLIIRTERVKVYNLHVEGLHLYAVGEHGVLVHNSGGSIVRKAAPAGRGPLTNPAVARKTYKGPWGTFKVIIRKNGDVVVGYHPKGSNLFFHYVWKDGRFVHFDFH
jgi:RHS repeat-associated protein